MVFGSRASKGPSWGKSQRQRTNQANKLSGRATASWNGSKVNCIIDCRLSLCTLFNKNDPHGRPLPAATHPLLIIVLLFQHFVTHGTLLSHGAQTKHRCHHSGGVQAPFMPPTVSESRFLRPQLCLFPSTTLREEAPSMLLGFNSISQPATVFAY